MEHEHLPPTASIPHQFIERKTISLFTPPCPFGDSNESNTTEVAIVVSQGDAEVARMSFTYIARELIVHFGFTHPFFVAHRCRQCGMTIDSPRVSSVADQASFFMDFDDLDQADARDSAAFECRESVTPDLPFMSNDIKVERSSLRDKSQNGTQHAPIKMSTSDSKRTCRHLEQTDDCGDTPLLRAARLNQCLEIETMLKQNPLLSQQVNREGDNLLHVLAKLPVESLSTAQSALNLLPRHFKKSLIMMPNKNGQRPHQVALNYGHRFFNDLLEREIKLFDENTI